MMYPQHSILLPKSGEQPYIPIVLTGEKKLSVATKGLIEPNVIASTMPRSTFRKLYPSLTDWKHNYSPLIRLDVRIPKSALARFKLRSCTKFLLVDDSVFTAEDQVYLDPRVVESIGQVRGSVLLYQMTWAYEASLGFLKTNAVLILGNYRTEGIWRMKAIQTEVNHVGMRGIILCDFPDFHTESLEQKTSMFASATGCTIVDNTFPSGAIDELRICANLRVLTCVLRESGKGATWMQRDYGFDYGNVKEFIYDMNPTATNYLPKVVHQAMEWAIGRLEDKAAYLNISYPWRVNQRIVEESIFPSVDTRAKLKFWEHLVWDFKEALRSLNLTGRSLP